MSVSIIIGFLTTFILKDRRRFGVISSISDVRCREAHYIMGGLVRTLDRMVVMAESIPEGLRDSINRDMNPDRQQLEDRNTVLSRESWRRIPHQEMRPLGFQCQRNGTIPHLV
jgi:hypothetical protein